MAYELQVFFRSNEASPSQVLEETLSACRRFGHTALVHPSSGRTWVAGDLELNEDPTGISVEIHGRDESAELAWQFASAASEPPRAIDVTGLGILTLSGSVHSELLATIRAHWVNRYDSLEYDEVDGFV